VTGGEAARFLGAMIADLERKNESTSNEMAAGLPSEINVGSHGVQGDADGRLQSSESLDGSTFLEGWRPVGWLSRLKPPLSRGVRLSLPFMGFWAVPG
jgi:hypothetical protein